MTFPIPFLHSIDYVGFLVSFVLIGLGFIVALLLARSVFFNKKLVHTSLLVRVAGAVLVAGFFAGVTVFGGGIIGVVSTEQLCLLGGGGECGAVGWAMFGYLFFVSPIALCASVLTGIFAATSWKNQLASVPTVWQKNVARSFWGLVVISIVALVVLGFLKDEYMTQKREKQLVQENQRKTALMERAGSANRFACSNDERVLEILDGVDVVLVSAGGMTVLGVDDRVPSTELIGEVLARLEGERLMPNEAIGALGRNFWTSFDDCINSDGHLLQDVFRR